MFLVTWHNAALSADRYETHELLADAQERYEELTQDDDMWSVSIAAVLRSTDYTPQFLMPLAKQQLHDHRQRLWNAETREQHQAIKQELQQ